MGINSLLYTARDAIAAQTYGLTVTGQNINNANTPGYVRREAILSSRIMGNETYGSVVVDGLRRPAEAYLEGRLFTSSSLAHAANTRGNQLAITEGIFNELAGTGLGDVLDRMARSFQELSVNPSDTVARDQVLRGLEDFVNRANETGQALATQRNEIFGSMGEVVSEINEHARAIAKLNEQIKNATLMGHDAADLKDKRNQALAALSPLIDIRVVDADDGQILLQAAGATLVEGNSFRELSLDMDASGNAVVRAGRPGSSTTTNITGGLTGGMLAGLKQVRDGDLRSMIDSFDRYVYDVATALNGQHASGYGLDGSTGNELFDLSAVTSAPAGAARSIQVSAAIASNPAAIAASGSDATLPGGADNAKRLAELFTSPVLSGGTQNPGEAYASLVGKVGTMRADAIRETSLREAMVSQAFELRESKLGVSMDEEMINLTRFQRAYQAASKLLSVADELLEELMGIVR